MNRQGSGEASGSGALAKHSKSIRLLAIVQFRVVANLRFSDEIQLCVITLVVTFIKHEKRNTIKHEN